MKGKWVQWNSLTVALFLVIWVLMACRVTAPKPATATQTSIAPPRHTATPTPARPSMTPASVPTLSPTPTPLLPWSGEPLNMPDSTGATLPMALALGPDGSVHAAWAIREEGQRAYWVFYEHRDSAPGAAWSAPELALEEPITSYGEHYKIQIIVDAQSAPHLFWNGDSRVVHIFRSPTGWENQVVSKSAPSVQGEMPSFAAAASMYGRIHLLWEDQTSLFWSSILMSGDEFVYPRPVNYPDYPDDCEEIGDVDMGIDQAGRLYTVWEGCGRIWFNNQDEIWGEPILLAENAAPHVAIAVEPSGEAHVVWVGFSGQVGGFWQTDRSLDGTWSNALFMPAEMQQDVSVISLVLAGEGNLALFGRWPVPQESVRYLTRRQGETWSAATILPHTPADRDEFALIGDGQGNLHMLRESNDIEEAYHLDYAVEPFQAIALPRAVLEAPALPTGLVEFSVVTSPGQRKDLSIAGDWVVWSQKGKEDWDIYAANLATGEQLPITTQAEDQLYPVTDGKIVVWEDHQEFRPKIHVFDLQTRQERLLNSRDSPQWAPDLSEDLVVYGGCSCIGDTCDFVIAPIPGYPVLFGCERDIWATNLSTGEDSPTVQRGQSLSQPQLSGTWVTWNQSDEGGGLLVGALDLQGSGKSQVLDLTRHVVQSDVHLDGPVLVWMSYDQNQIWAYNLANSDQVSILYSPNKIGEPDISGGMVVWADNRNGTMDIFGYNLTTGEEFPICLAPGDQVMPRIHGNVVVWIDQRIGKDEIYAARLPFQNPGVPKQLKPAPGP